MENLNEGKKKTSKKSYMMELAEIDAQSAIVAMEAKIGKLEEMAKAKETRLEMVSEDENLSELISKSAVKEMQKEIKEIRKMQEKLKKVYEKKNGKKTPEMVDEYDSSPQMIPDEKEDGTFDMSSVGMKEEEIDEAHCNTEEDDVREETNEEVNRWQKLAGISVQENKILKEEKYSGAIIRKGTSDKAKEDTKIVRQALKKAGIKFTPRKEFGMDFKDADLAQIKKVIADAKVGEFIISHDEDKSK